MSIARESERMILVRIVLDESSSELEEWPATPE